jgi:hypothetical protein
MKLLLLSSSVCSALAAISGDLTVQSADGVVAIKGDVEGLPASTTQAGIHVHTGLECTANGETTVSGVNTHIGGHLMSNTIDGWVFPEQTTYDTDGAGMATVDIKATSFALAAADTTIAKPAVEGHCVVMHGLTGTDLSPRVAIGKITKDGDVYSADMGNYPGPTTLATTPAGKLVVTVEGDGVKLAGDLTGLAMNIVGGGIHVHAGTDCSPSDVSTAAAVNAVVKGHLLSKGDGFKYWMYDSDTAGKAAIDWSTSKGSYVLKTTDATDLTPFVENRCIVMHDANSARIAIGQIVCSTAGCKAAMGAYPVPASVTTTASVTTESTTASVDTEASTTTTVPATTKTISKATNAFLGLSALAVSWIISVL